jgi:signal transduction histidine kinase
MEAMITSVLDFIRDASEPSRRQRADLRSIVECVVDDAAMLGAEAVLEPGGPVTVDVDMLAIQRVLTNLVDNAIRYGDQAKVCLSTRDGEAVVEIADSGPGLSPAELERVFQPFYRSEPARTLEVGGVGLGLSLSRSIARAHGGEVELRPGAPGLIATLRLPLPATGVAPKRSKAAAL